ncbi:alkaline phosphatase D family protein [Crateriforma spongiae]|uniref:hypothetical protein n=1 Tax=Crateriforma spongiae TaxID=2724528 RepID=UPI001447BF99|nr:hypothetical protein [Crateriforma spongiae]
MRFLIFPIVAFAMLMSTTIVAEDASMDQPRTAGSTWRGSRIWIGPDWWANPLTDWRIRDGVVHAAAGKDRTLCWLPAEVETDPDSADGQNLDLSVDVAFVPKKGDKSSRPITAGFRIGRRGGIAEYRHALVSATKFFDAGLRSNGRLVLGSITSDESVTIGDASIRLTLTGKRSGQRIALTLSADNGQQTWQIQDTVDLDQVIGGISLLADGPPRAGGSRPAAMCKFANVDLKGSLISSHPDRSFGPILWSQYTRDQNRVRLMVQFAPLGKGNRSKARLCLRGEDNQGDFREFEKQPVEKLSRTAVFTLDDWAGAVDRDYQIRFDWLGQTYRWTGTIRAEPAADEPFQLACFSCDNGYLFPIPAMVGQVSRQDPDMMFFAGDQIYESYGGFGVVRSADTPVAMLDYLRKYYQFGWTWRDLLKDRPSVILPDDHDVFQGNIWGHGGRALPPSDKKNDWAAGGYLMPADWVNAVERTQVGSLPDPAIDKVLPHGIKPYFTDLTYAGIGFAILEDRKFKTGPNAIPASDRPRGDGYDLLGPDQEAFLAQWADDWTGQRVKVALSQTIFCNAATYVGENLKRGRYYHDSGAWPVEARNRAVRILGDCEAFSIHGDQHLGVLLRQGVDDFDDAGYAFMVPGTANGFPRAWWPGVDKGQPEPGGDYTGKFRDDAGHPIHVLAVGNPQPGSNLLPKTTDPMEIGYRKGSGYGVVDFSPDRRSAKISLYRLGDQEEMFEGFPQTIQIRSRSK